MQRELVAASEGPSAGHLSILQFSSSSFSEQRSATSAIKFCPVTKMTGYCYGYHQKLEYLEGLYV